MRMEFFELQRIFNYATATYLFIIRLIKNGFLPPALDAKNYSSRLKSAVYLNSLKLLKVGICGRCKKVQPNQLATACFWFVMKI